MAEPRDHDQHEISRRDPASSGGDAEAAASVKEREDVAADDDDLFDDAGRDEDE